MCVCACAHARACVRVRVCARAPRHTLVSQKQQKFGILASGQRSLRTDTPNYAFLLKKLCSGVCYKDK